MWYELSRSWRTAWRHRRCALVAILSLSIGIGVSTAMFGIVSAVLLKPLPYKQAASLVLIWGSKDVNIRRGIAIPNLVDLRRSSENLEDLAIFIPPSPMPLDDGKREQTSILCAYVDDRFFPLLGAPFAFGNATMAGEDSAADAIVISDLLWSARFGREKEILGRSLRIGQRMYRVRGVAPPAMQLPNPLVDAWLPLGSLGASLEDRNVAIAQAVARLKPYKDRAAITTEFDVAASRLGKAYPESNRTLQFGVFDLHQVILGKYSRALWIFLGGILILLGVSCLNAIAIQIAKQTARRQEMALRSALGATTASLVRQAALESLPVTIASTACGTALTWLLLRWLRAAPFVDIPRVKEVATDLPVVSFALIVGFIATIACGVIPTLHCMRRTGAAVLSGHRGSVRPTSVVPLEMLVVVQAATAMALVVVSLLFMASFVRLARLAWGLDAGQVGLVTVQADAALTRNAQTQLTAIESVLEVVRHTPGVTVAAWSSGAPGSKWWGFRNARIGVGGRLANVGWPVTGWYVTRDFFTVLSASTTRGTMADCVRGDAQVMLVSDSLAKRLWPGNDPVGQRVELLAPSRQLKNWMASHSSLLTPEVANDPASWQSIGPPTVVGCVVRDIRILPPDIPMEPSVYIEISRVADVPALAMQHFLFRTTVDVAEVIPKVRHIVVAVEPRYHVAQALPLEEVIGLSIGSGASSRLLTAVAATFGLLAMILMATGVYGMISITITHRLHELAIRIALGADTRFLIARIMGRTMGIVGLGTLLGAALGNVLSLVEK